MSFVKSTGIRSRVGSEFLSCSDGYFPKNNIVFMGSPPIKAPPYSNFDLTSLEHATYNGTKEINLVNHYLHGPTGRNKLIVILMKNDVKLTNLTL